MCHVSARLRRPQDGLFIGVIDALDTVNNTYRVTFDRPGLGTYSVPDVEVLVSNSDICGVRFTVTTPAVISGRQILYPLKNSSFYNGWISCSVFARGCRAVCGG